MKTNNIFKNTTFLKYFKNTSYLIFEKILRMILWVFIFTWMARYLGPHDFGIFTYVDSIIHILIVFSTLGLDTIVIKELVKNKNNSYEIIGSSFFIKLFSSFILLFFILIYINFVENEYPINMLLLIISTSFIFYSFNVIDFYFQSIVLSKYIVFSRLIALSISSSAKVFLILNEYPLIYFGMVIVLESIIIALGLIFFYLKKNKKILSWKFNLTTIKEILKKSYPLLFALILTTIYSKIDQIMIKEILDVTQSGYYSAAVRLSEIWFIIGALICASLFPLIIKSKDISNEHYYKRIQQLLVLLTVIAYIVILCVYFLSDYIITFLYGIEFLESSLVLTIHIISTIFVYQGLVSSKWIVIENRTKLEFYRNLLGVVVNIILNLIFIKKFGIVGAAYASLITYMTAYYLFDVLLKETRKIFILKTKALFLVTKD